MTATVHPSYISAFDGIRGISVLIVFFAHMGFEHIIPGGLGVTIFFFISGFLITRLLIGEFEKSNTINLKSFFIRRLLRLYPPLLFFIFIMSGLLLAFEPVFNLPELAAAVFYYINYYVILSPDAIRRFDILWSLAIEEHFYLFFPLLFLAFIRSKKALIAVIILLILASLLIRIYISLKYNASEYAAYYTNLLTHCRADAIMYGCLLSLIIHSDKEQKLLQFSSSPLVFLGALGLMLFTLLFRDEFFRQTFRYSVQGIALLILIPPILYNSRYFFLNKLLSLKPLTFIGKLSYSIYLFHWVALYIGITFFVKGSLNWYLVYTFIAFALAITSYYLVEKRVNVWRKRFGSVIH